MPSQTMTAAVLNAAPGGLQIEQLPIPEPQANEVLIKVHSCGVCHTDLHVMKAEVAFPTPAVMGHEVSGTVVVPVFERLYPFVYVSETRAKRRNSPIALSLII